MAVEITETPRHTLTVSEQNWQLKLSTLSAAALPATVAELTDATTYDFPTLNTPVSDALAAKANSADLGTIAAFEGNQNLRTTDSPTFAGIFTGEYVKAISSPTGQQCGFGYTNNGCAFYRYSSVISSFVNGASVGGSSGLNLYNNLVGWGTSGLSALNLGIGPNAIAGTAEINNGTTGTLRDLSLRNLTASGTVTLTGTEPKIYIQNLPSYNKGIELPSYTRIHWNGGAGQYIRGWSGRLQLYVASTNNLTLENSTLKHVGVNGISTTGPVVGTNLTASGTVTATTSHEGPVGAIAPNTGAFTTLAASSVVLGGFPSSTITGSSVGTVIGNGEVIARVGEGLIAKNRIQISSLGDTGFPDNRLIGVGNGILELRTSSASTFGELRLGTLTASGTVTAGGVVNANGGIATSGDRLVDAGGPANRFRTGYFGLVTVGSNGGAVIVMGNSAGTLSLGGTVLSLGAVTTSQTNTFGALNHTGNITASGTVQTGSYTVATLPTPSTGMRAYVTDSDKAAHGHFGGTVAAGGSNIVPVFYDGTNWIIA